MNIITIVVIITTEKIAIKIDHISKKIVLYSQSLLILLSTFCLISV